MAQLNKAYCQSSSKYRKSKRLPGKAWELSVTAHPLIGDDDDKF